MTKENDIQQFFKELKTHDQQLAPDFEHTYQIAAKRRVDRLWYMRRAAAITFIVVASFVMMWFVADRPANHFDQITVSNWSSSVDHSFLYPDLPLQSISNWRSPTEFTFPPAYGKEAELSNWKSPTDFLLITSEKQQ